MSELILDGLRARSASAQDVQRWRVAGHRQVTDAWLLGLVAERNASVATLDRGLHSFAHSEGLAKHVERIEAAPAAHEPAAAYAPRRATRARGR